MKRGSSGLSLVVAVNKPSGMSSHDVVNRARRAFGERRVGHAGTLDPLASGVLPILVGPATRLDNYMVEHDKTYVADVVFGKSTTTDDIEGDVLHEGDVPSKIFDEDFAKRFVNTLIGKSKQIPPAYSAIKVNGKKACDEARKGNFIKLEGRDIEVFDAKLLSVNIPEGSASDKYCGAPYWTIFFNVSKGTYIRALARDIGAKLGTYAFIGALERTRVGGIELDECISLDALDSLKEKAAIDPTFQLGIRIAFPGDEAKCKIENGGAVAASDVKIYEIRHPYNNADSCTSRILKSCDPLADGEKIAVICDNRLKAIYFFDAASSKLKSECVFQVGVSRGCEI